MIDRAQMEDEHGSELPTVNRFAVLLVPTDKFRAWANSCPGGEQQASLGELRQEPTAYLISEGDGEAGKYVERHYKRMLIEELNGWYTDQSVWPELSLRTFRAFFEVHVASMVFDLSPQPLERDE